MDTFAMTFLVAFSDLLDGKLSLISLGVVIVDDITKNSSNKKMMSVMDDIEKDGSVLYFLFNDIVF